MDALKPYPFERLSQLLSGVSPPSDQPVISFAIGEPTQPPPSAVLSALTDALESAGNYPATLGTIELRESCAEWAARRFKVPTGWIDPAQHVLPVNGTREALFAFAQCLIDPIPGAKVAMPNPCYQIYEGAALLAGAEPFYMNCWPVNHNLPDPGAIPAATLADCQLVYLCTPNNPTGAVASLDYLVQWLELADRYDFVIAGDECYSEIYPDESSPPPGLLQACAVTGRRDFHRCMVFHSLSKRSNLPGLRSGFVAGDADLIRLFLRYRTYHGSAMPPPTQAASISAWRDEAHVVRNRANYRQAFDSALEILSPLSDIKAPAGGFYLWLPTPGSDIDFALAAYRDHGVRVVPGSYLSRPTAEGDPGQDYVRISLVAPPEQVGPGIARLARCLEAG